MNGQGEATEMNDSPTVRVPRKTQHSEGLDAPGLTEGVRIAPQKEALQLRRNDGID